MPGLCIAHTFLVRELKPVPIMKEINAGNSEIAGMENSISKEKRNKKV